MYRLLTIFLSFMLSIGVLAAGVDQGEPASIVWGAKVSPFVRKVLIAMEYKGIPYKNHDILPAVLLKSLKKEVPEEFIKVSPLGKIPAYQHGDFSVADSAVILAYLEKIHPEKPLYPADPQLFARALWLEKYGDTVLSGVSHTVIIESLINPQILKIATDHDALQKAVNQELPPILDYLEGQLSAPYAGRYFIGNTMTVADISVGTHLVTLKLLQVEVDSKRWPKLSNYFHQLLEEPSFKKVLQE